MTLAKLCCSGSYHCLDEGVGGVLRVDEEAVVTRGNLSVSKNSPQKVRVCYQKGVFPEELFKRGSEEKMLLLFLKVRRGY